MAPPNLDQPQLYVLLPPDDDEDKSIDSGPPKDSDIVSANQSSDDICSDDIKVVVPSDGGWGWVIVFASFMCNVIVDGIIFSYGMFLEGIATEFGVTRSRASLPGSLMSGFYLIVGPFASAIANKFGFRPVAIIGAVLGACAFAVSSFATNVEFLCVTYGLLGGIGFGFIYVPAVITVGFYFEKWRALATGISVCGSGIGTFLFAPLTKVLINSMGWRNTLLIHGAIVLSCLLFGILFRPLKPKKLKEINLDQEDFEETSEVEEPTLPSATVLKMEEPFQQNLKNNHESLLSRLYAKNNITDQLKLSDVYHTIHHFPSDTHHKRMPLENHFKERRLSVPFLNPESQPKEQIVRGQKLHHHHRHHHREDMIRPLYRDDIFFGQSLARLPEYTSQSSVAYNLAVTRLPPQEDVLEEKAHKCKLYPEAVKRALNTMLDFSLLKSPSFLIMAIGGFFTMMGFYVPFMYLVERATGSGSMPEDRAVLLISSVGIANTMGRVLCGVLSSFPSINALTVTNVALSVGGLATIASGLSVSQEYQFFYTVVFGLSISCFASLRSIIVVDLLGLEKLTNAFGLLLLFQGVAATIGSPLAGAFMDATGSYDASFYLSGSMILISAIMCYPLSWVNRWERNRTNQSANNI